MNLDEAAKTLEAARAPKNDSAEKDEALPSIATIEINSTTQRGTNYKGRFYYKVPTLQEQIDIGVIKQMMAPNGVMDPTAATLVETLAYLQVCIKFSPSFPKPDWWNPSGEMYDDDPFLELYGRCREYENAFRGRDKKRRPDAGADRTEVGPGGDGEAPVGRKVQPPAKRRETLAGDDEGGT